MAHRCTFVWNDVRFPRKAEVCHEPAWRQVSSSLPADIPRQRVSLSLALCAGEILPCAKPTETSFVNRSTSSAKNELARAFFPCAALVGAPMCSAF